jgi:predicted membrane protein
MIIFTILGILTAVFIFIVILITIIEGRVKSKSTEKLLWKMDKVETRTGGLENDRLNERQ